MDKHTFGNSQASVNLITDILEKPEYKNYSTKVARVLDKHFKVLIVVSRIPNETIRRATMEMWHKHFSARLEGLPEIIKTHTLCVMSTRYHELLAKGG